MNFFQNLVDPPKKKKSTEEIADDAKYNIKQYIRDCRRSIAKYETNLANVQRNYDVAVSRNDEVKGVAALRIKRKYEQTIKKLNQKESQMEMLLTELDEALIQMRSNSVHVDVANTFTALNREISVSKIQATNMKLGAQHEKFTELMKSIDESFDEVNEGLMETDDGDGDDTGDLRAEFNKSMEMNMEAERLRMLSPSAKPPSKSATSNPNLPPTVSLMLDEMFPNDHDDGKK